MMHLDKIPVSPPHPPKKLFSSTRLIPIPANPTAQQKTRMHSPTAINGINRLCGVYLRDVLSLLPREDIDTGCRQVSSHLDYTAWQCPESRLPRPQLLSLKVECDSQPLTDTDAVPLDFGRLRDECCQWLKVRSSLIPRPPSHQSQPITGRCLQPGRGAHRSRPPTPPHRASQRGGARIRRLLGAHQPAG
jgi:hypothetical protein